MEWVQRLKHKTLNISTKKKYNKNMQRHTQVQAHIFTYMLKEDSIKVWEKRCT